MSASDGPRVVALCGSQRDGVRDDGVADRVGKPGAELVAYAGVDRYPDVVDAPVEATTEATSGG